MSTVSDVIAEVLPGATERIVEAVGAEIPVYAVESDGDFAALVRSGVEQALQRFPAMLNDPHAVEDPQWRAVISDLGRSAVRAGRSLEVLLAAYRVGARYAWRDIAAAGDRAGVPSAELYRLAEELFLYIDELSALSAEGFAAEQAERAGERQRVRRALAALLLQTPAPDPAVLADAAHAAGWPVPALAAVLVADTREPERLAGRISPDTLAGAGDELATLVIPDPDAPGRRGAITAALAGIPSALGPTAAPVELPRGADRARRALLLAREGVLLPGEPVICDEHLLTLLAHRDESLLADLSAEALAPLADLAGAARDKLLDTLRAYLDHQGRMDPTARQLGVHPQTIRYRVTQLRQLFGPALEDPDGRLALQLALRAAPGA